jgi:hypothetical protein
MGSDVDLAVTDGALLGIGLLELEAPGREAISNLSSVDLSSV